jgi:hypothetical protein
MVAHLLRLSMYKNVHVSSRNYIIMYKNVHQRYMKKDKTRVTNQRLADMWDKMKSEVVLGYKAGAKKITNTSYSSKGSSQRQLLIPTEFVMVDPSLLTSLLAGSQKVVMRIIAELKKNNALWYCEYRLKGKIERHISVLRKKNVLLKTDDTNIHLVNPWLIRRGSVDGVIIATTILIDKSDELSEKLVKDLKTPSEADRNLFYVLTANEDSLKIKK